MGGAGREEEEQGGAPKARMEKPMTKMRLPTLPTACVTGSTFSSAWYATCVFVQGVRRTYESGCETIVFSGELFWRTACTFALDL